MELKQQILKLLEENRGEYINGEEIASKLFVTRSAVWKAIKALKKEGYRITAVTNKGYCLLPDNDIVSLESIAPYKRGGKHFHPRGLPIGYFNQYPSQRTGWPRGKGRYRYYSQRTD